MRIRKEGLAAPSAYRTGPIAAGSGVQRVDREGGRDGAGVIYGVALVTSGVEALGHGQWVDGVFVRQIARATLESSNGVKARYKHPGVSGDALGRLLGRIHPPEAAATPEDLLSEGKCLADLHFSPSAHKTPDGNLAEYIMDIAESEADTFGLSVVFKFDEAAEDEFMKAHTADGKFKSPDAANEKSYPHARLAALRAVDAVGDPAANPDGLYGVANGAEIHDAIAYCLGDSYLMPRSALFGETVHLGRVRDAVARYRALRDPNPNRNFLAELEIADAESSMP